jgi:transcriptional regulator
MYIPASFAETRPEMLHDFMAAHSFATLISEHEGEPFASHLPLLLERRVPPHGRLVGHMARANPQWRSAAGQRVMIVFHGPHAYISPRWYESRDTVPTWNYVAVHAWGTLTLIEDPDRLRNLLMQTVDVYEASRPEPWSVDEPEPGFVDKLLSAIVGFEIDLDRIEGKWKLNQNHPPERREKVIRHLLSSGNSDAELIAKLMQDSLIGSSDDR